MKTNNWMNLDYHEYVTIDLIDYRRIELEKGDNLLISSDSVCIQQKNGYSVIYPAVNVIQIMKRLKPKYI